MGKKKSSKKNESNGASSNDMESGDLIPIDMIMSGQIPDNVPDKVKARLPGKYCAIDCEMVGVGIKGSTSILARVSIVNIHGVVVYDSFVAPSARVTDYRTWVSGITPQHLKNAPSFNKVQDDVVNLLNGRVIIGHAIKNDLDVLNITADAQDIRDTSKYAPLKRLMRSRLVGLRTLSKTVLGLDIQSGEHDSITDARATMALYRSQRGPWEAYLAKKKRNLLLDMTTTPNLRRIQEVSVTKSDKGESILPEDPDSPDFRQLLDILPDTIVKRSKKKKLLDQESSAAPSSSKITTMKLPTQSARDQVLAQLGLQDSTQASTKQSSKENVDADTSMAMDIDASYSKLNQLNENTTSKSSVQAGAIIDDDPLARYMIKEFGIVSPDDLELNITSKPRSKSVPPKPPATSSTLSTSSSSKKANNTSSSLARSKSISGLEANGSGKGTKRKSSGSSEVKKSRSNSTEGWWRL